MGLGLGLALMSRRERIQQLMVSLDQQKASVTTEKVEMEIQVFHGRTKECEFDGLLLAFILSCRRKTCGLFLYVWEHVAKLKKVWTFMGR